MRNLKGLSRRHFIGGLGAVSCLPAFAAASKSEAGKPILLHAAPHPAPGAPAGSANWLFNGLAPGPVMRAKAGQLLQIRVENALPDEILFDFYGIRGVGRATYAAPIPAGAAVDYKIRLPDAGTCFYRAIAPSAPARSAQLCGAIIVEDNKSADADRDIPLLVASGPDAPGMLVNDSRPFEIGAVAGERLRLRWINASPHWLPIRLDQHDMWVIALDGRPAEPFLAHSGFFALGPGNRLDVMVDATLGPGAVQPFVTPGPAGDVALANIVYGPGRNERPRRSTPAMLPEGNLPRRMDFRNAARHEIALTDAPAPATFEVKRGRVVILKLSNSSEVRQAVHFEGHAARLLDRLDDGWKPFWVDTLTLDPGEVARVAFIAEFPGRWEATSMRLGTFERKTAAQFTTS